MREIRPSGSEGGGQHSDAAFLPLYIAQPVSVGWFTRSRRYAITSLLSDRRST